MSDKTDKENIMPIKGNVGMASYPRTTALILGAGDSTTPYTDTNTGIADKNFFGFWVKSTATSGTTRANYTRLYLSSGAGGEAGRFFTTVENAAPADTCNGIHSSINFGSSAGNITGLGTALRATFHVPNRSLTGTTAAVQAEFYSDGASSAIGGTTSVIRAVNDGNASGKASVDSNANLLELSGFTAGSGKLWESAGTVGQSLKVVSSGSNFYIPTLPATTTGIVLGVGSAAANYNFGSTADKNAVNFHFTTAAASGTSRGIYNRLYLTGGAGGESLRTYTTVSSNTPADTVNGAHLSLDFGAAAGNITGLGTASRSTLHIPAGRAINGTIAAVQAEIYGDGASAAIGGVASFLRCVVDGHADIKTSVDTNGFLAEVAGVSAGANNLWRTGLTAATINAATTCALRIKVAGTTYYIPVATATV